MSEFSSDIIPAGYSGQLFAEEPSAQVEAHNKQRGDTLDQLPLLKEVVDHLDKQIAFLNSVDSVDTNLATEPQVHQQICAANKLAKDKLTIERSFIQGRIDSL